MRRLTLATAPALSHRARPLHAVTSPEPVSDLEATRKVLSSSDVVPSLRARGVDTGVFACGGNEDATNFYAVRALSPEDLMGAADDEAPDATDDVQAIEATVILSPRSGGASLSPRSGGATSQSLAQVDATAPVELGAELDEAPPSVTMVDVAAPSPSVGAASLPFVFSLADAYAPEPAPRVVSEPPPAPMRALAPTMTIPRPVAPTAPRRVWPVVVLFAITFLTLAGAFVLTMPHAPEARAGANGKAAPVAAALEAAPRNASSAVEEMDAPAAAKAVAPRPRAHVVPRPAKVEAPSESDELAKKQIDAL